MDLIIFLITKSIRKIIEREIATKTKIDDQSAIESLTPAFSNISFSLFRKKSIFI
jgi:hypothetical protein